MPVVAVINRKGGSGKSTLATHLAAYCANEGMPVMLGDVDQQQSTQTWLRRRSAQQLAQPLAIVGWAVDPKNVLRAPAGIKHMVLDTPGGMRGFELARVAMFADAILMPVCNSVFDRESTADCYAELLTFPRIASGRCKVAAVGMRLDARTSADEVLRKWAERLQLPFVGALRETQAYVKCIERGLTLFDLPAAQVKADMDQWKPILQWLNPVLHGAPALNGADRRPTRPAALGSASTGGIKPVPVSNGSSAFARPNGNAAQPIAVEPIARPSMAARLGRLLGVLPKHELPVRQR
jgi:chromosome partitioning protein